MSRQDKATTERNARILRDLVKQPDNKSCADCRKNDARWASWNLGVFLCIRCSGIHRSMGTHISKVKSIDLDIWTPEQMDNIQRWGNKRANLYWEKHLKAGHVPPDHKIESFIRSKYESKRWAMDGPPPRDPSTLENGGGSVAPSEPPKPTPTSSAPPPAPAAAPKHHPLLSRTAKPAPSPAPAPAPMVDLFGLDEPPSLAPPVTTAPPTSQPSAAQAAPAPTAGAQPPAPTQTQGSIFDLDFRTPTPSTQTQAQQPKNAKADIMSLFSSTSPPTTAPTSGGFFNAPPPPAQNQNQYGSWNGGITSSAPPQPSYQHQAQLPTPTTGGGGGGWGGISVDQNAWGSPAQAQPPAQAQQQQQQSNPWGSNNTSDPWASSGGGGGGGFFGASNGNGLGGIQPQKKDDRDPFANIWG
ncbi:hypothetical protein I302_107814 [Kwoniella bestiolae CBS 10118]|uniref:Arf-GAP domain-containing protein n=1 Tax=Kwoniella bestiolae CBS 10118 TaxID=1296100 RepID=A0A1B9FXH2_9TREE|nr:hypothetical protein I302_06446 [Kwoniella bestiolae CBS 10118]OCF23464.1 hypothetical protein I302_06446 [Kwoniella bestiolae CBS 10118]